MKLSFDAAMLCAFIAAVLVLAFFAVKSGHWFKAAVLTAASGFAALFAVNLTASVSGVIIPINLYTMCISSVLGMPGVILILAMSAAFLL